MRSIRTAVAVLSLAALALAGCGSDEPSAPAASGTTPTTTVAPATTPPPATSGGSVVTRPGPAEAVSTAVAFVRREVGMRDLVAGPFRWTGRQTGRVEVRPRFSGDGHSVTGPVTAVNLQRLSRVWYVLGTSTSTIRVTAPLPGARVASPLRVAGTALAFEGGVNVKVTEDRYGLDRLLGSGFVTGGGDVMRPFSGQVSYLRPGGRTGSVIFYELSAANGVDVVKATTVRVHLTTSPPPRIVRVRMVPALPLRGGWVQLPHGAGALTFAVEATSTERVRLSFAPTGTGTASLTKVLAQDASASGGWRLTWHYPAEAGTGHLFVHTFGPGGQAEWSVNVYHW
jgi:hypothetical protein